MLITEDFLPTKSISKGRARNNDDFEAFAKVEILSLSSSKQKLNLEQIQEVNITIKK